MVSQNSNAPHKQFFWACLFLGALVLSMYAPVSHFEFVNLDDDIYVFGNPHLQNGLTLEGIKWAFTADLFSNSPNADYWQPVTFLSRMIDVSLFGFNPSGHHAMNLLLHLANTLLVLYLFYSMTGALWSSAALAVIFAVHPLQTEPVAWVTARKDLLSTFFCFLSINAYLRYLRTTSSKNYFFVFLYFILAVMSKPWTVVLPLLLMILDFWPLGRFNSKSVLKKKYLYLISGAFALTPFLGQPQALTYSNPVVVVKNVLVNYIEYLQKAFYPVGLAIQSAHPEVVATSREVAMAAAVLILITVLVLRLSKTFPYLLSGWLWFITALIPMVGLLPPGDRFMYVPLIGLWVMVIWGFSDIVKIIPKLKLPLIGILLLTIGAFSFLLTKQLSIWRNNETLFKHSINSSSGNFVAHNNLAVTLIAQGKLSQAENHYLEAQNIRQDNIINTNLGSILAKQGKFEEAMKHFEEALRSNPKYAEAHNNLGNLFMEQGKTEDAVSHYLEAIKLKPSLFEAQANLGFYYANHGNNEKAIIHLSKVVQFQPSHLKAHFYLANLYMEAGNTIEAEKHFRKAVTLNPNDAYIRNGLAILLASRSAFKEAEEHFLAVIRIDPNIADAYFNLGFLYMKQGQFETARGFLLKALELNPDYEKAKMAMPIVESNINQSKPS